MTKSTCQVCNTTFRGIPLNAYKEGKQVEVCPSCFRKLDAEYRKNSCLACAFFHVGNCELFGTELDEPYISYLTCGFFTVETDAGSIANARIKKFEMSGRFEEAAQEYEKIGKPELAAAERNKICNAPVAPTDLEGLIGQLRQRGQTLTYFCCHCGAPLKVGAKDEAAKACPKCKYDLVAIDLAKLISQHL